MEYKSLFDYYQWRYDRELNEKEVQDEHALNKEMTYYIPHDLHDGKWDDIYWLLTEWRKNTQLVHTEKNKEIRIRLLQHRYVLDHYLNTYLIRQMRREIQGW